MVGSGSGTGPLDFEFPGLVRIPRHWVKRSGTGPRDTAYLNTQEHNYLNATFICHQKLPRPRNTEYRLSWISSEGGSWLQGTFCMLVIQVQCPIYKFIYPESERVLLAGDTSERQSLTRTITHYIQFYIFLIL